MYHSKIQGPVFSSSARDSATVTVAAESGGVAASPASSLMLYLCFVIISPRWQSVMARAVNFMGMTCEAGCSRQQLMSHAHTALAAHVLTFTPRSSTHVLTFTPLEQLTSHAHQQHVCGSHATEYPWMKRWQQTSTRMSTCKLAYSNTNSPGACQQWI